MAHATTRAFADERRAAIMEMLEHNASVQVAEIAQTFGVSSVTARADLDALAESGKLRRTHGGAVSLQKRLTVSTQDRRINVNVAAKQAIAQSAIELVGNGDTLLVDSGTTALEFVRLLDQHDGCLLYTSYRACNRHTSETRQQGCSAPGFRSSRWQLTYRTSPR